MSTNQESVHTAEVNITVTSEQLADDSYVKKLLVTTKMNVLAEIAACNDTSVSDMVKEYCPEVYNYSDILDKYSITHDESTKKKKPKLLAKKKKPMIKKVESESPKPSTPIASASESTSPKLSTPESSTPKPSTPKPSTPVVASSEISSPTDESKSKPTEATKPKKPKKKLPKKKPKPTSSED